MRTPQQEEEAIEQQLMERAFELAEAGDCQSIADIKKQLKSEQFSAVEQHLAGSFTQKQLKLIMADAA